MVEIKIENDDGDFISIIEEMIDAGHAQKTRTIHAVKGASNAASVLSLIINVKLRILKLGKE